MVTRHVAVIEMTAKLLFQRCMNLLDVGACEYLSDVLSKVLRKVANQPDSKDDLELLLLVSLCCSGKLFNMPGDPFGMKVKCIEKKAIKVHDSSSFVCVIQSGCLLSCDKAHVWLVIHGKSENDS